MSLLPSTQPAPVFRAIARSIAALTCAIGILVIANLVLSEDALASIRADWINMKANTALCFVLAGASLLLLLRGSRNPLWTRIAQALAAVVFLAGALNVLEYALRIDLGIDQAILRDRVSSAATAVPGRMAVTTAVNFVLLGWSLFFHKNRRGPVMQVPAVLAGCIGILGVFGYLYGARGLTTIGPQMIALGSALTFVIFSLGVILGQPDAGFMRLASHTEIGGMLVRRLLPAMVLVPFVLGWLISAGEHQGWYVHETGWALFALATAIALAATVGRSAAILNRLDASLRESAVTLKAEQALRESNERYRTLFENMLDGYAYCRMIFQGDEPVDFVYIEVNSAFKEITGLSDVEGRRASEVNPGLRQTNPRMFVVNARVARTGVPERMEVYLETQKKWVFISVYSPAQDHFVTIFENISDRKNLERGLEQQKNLLMTVIDSVPDLVFVKDTQGRFILANKALAQAAGVADPRALIGQTDYEISPREIADRYVADDRVVLESGQGKINTEELSTFGGAPPRWILTSKVPLLDEKGAVSGLVGISRDITERRELEANMQQTQKLESLGVLAGGIAHDFNNILTIVLGNAEVAALRAPAGSPVRKPMEEIRKASLRAADLSRQMLAYSGRGHFEIKPLDLSEVIRDMLDMLNVGISRKTALQVLLADDLPVIEGDISQLRQVVMNLVMNAAEAIGDTTGEITVTTTAVDCDRPCLDSGWGGEPLAPGRYVSVEVTDTGSGMDERTRARIFEPFFTTKFTGRGLGLSAVLGIVRGHKGAIQVTSSPGHGATFRVLFPVGAGAVLRPTPPAREPAVLKGTGTILVADDEEGILFIARTFLEGLGFSVLTARDGSEALEVYRAHKDEVACVMLDLTMPKMNGEETFRCLRAITPDVKVLLCSGYSEQQAVRHFVGGGLAGFLQKPYLRETLSQKLREILGTKVLEGGTHAGKDPD